MRDVEFGCRTRDLLLYVDLGGGVCGAYLVWRDGRLGCPPPPPHRPWEHSRRECSCTQEYSWIHNFNALISKCSLIHTIYVFTLIVLSQGSWIHNVCALTQLSNNTICVSVCSCIHHGIMVAWFWFAAEAVKNRTSKQNHKPWKCWSKPQGRIQIMCSHLRVWQFYSWFTKKLEWTFLG